MAMSLGIALIPSFLLFLAVVIFPVGVMNIFTRNPDVVALGASFLSITAPCYLMVAVTACFAGALRSLHRVVLPLEANILGIVTNTVLNYLLIFGNFGFPALGVAGAAIATLIARFLEMACILILTGLKEPELFPRVRNFFTIPKDLFRRFVKHSGIIILKDVIWAVGVSVYMIVYAAMGENDATGTDAVASINITSAVRMLSAALFNGIANASLIIVGNIIGARDPAKAYRYAGKFLRITLILGVVIGIAMILTRSIVLSPYDVSQTVSNGASNILLIYGAAFFIYVFNMVAVVGVMRSGGDNMFCAIMDTIAVWFIGLPLTLVAVFVLKLPLEWVFALIATQEVFKMILLAARYRSKKWINNLVEDIG
jgi:putative MATE family efflux protein